MNRAQLIKELGKYKKSHHKQYGIDSLGIFGSFSRDEASPGSDVDVVVHLVKQDLFNIIGIKQDLEETLQLPVDIVSYRPRMDSFLKERIDKEAVYV